MMLIFSSRAHTIFATIHTIINNGVSLTSNRSDVTTAVECAQTGALMYFEVYELRYLVCILVLQTDIIAHVIYSLVRVPRLRQANPTPALVHNHVCLFAPTGQPGPVPLHMVSLATFHWAEGKKHTPTFIQWPFETRKRHCCRWIYALLELHYEFQQLVEICSGIIVGSLLFLYKDLCHLQISN